MRDLLRGVTRALIKVRGHWASELEGLALRLPHSARLPAVFGIAYLFAILIFALLYVFFGLTVESEIHGNRTANILDCIYFSVVTITTLGYGDISPVGFFQKLFVVLETLIGVCAFGLFLTAVGYELSNRQSQIERTSIESRRELYLAGLYRKIAERLSNFLNTYHQPERSQEPYEKYLFKDLHLLQVKMFKFEVGYLTRQTLGCISKDPKMTPHTIFSVFVKSTQKLKKDLQEELDRYRYAIEDVSEIRRTEEMIDHVDQIQYTFRFSGTWDVEKSTDLQADSDWIAMTSNMKLFFADLQTMRSRYLSHATILDQDQQRADAISEPSKVVVSWSSWLRAYLRL